MAFSRPTLSTIYNRMIADYEQRLNDDGPVSVISRKLGSILIAVFAGAIHPCHGFLVNLSKNLFYPTATTEFLDWHARMWGLPRKPGTKATGEISITGTPSTDVPAGTQFQREDGTVYVTDSLVTIAAGGSVFADITALLSGTNGNTDSAVLVSLVNAISGVDEQATSTGNYKGGTDQETNSELITRLLQRTQNPPGSGNEGDYERWALEVDGVGRAWALSAEEFQGGGTVGVVIATSELEVVSTAIKTDVVNYIETKRPIGAGVEVVDPVIVEIDYAISITPNTSTYQDAVTENLEELFYLSSNVGGNSGATLKLSEMRTAISTANVTDYEITSISRDDGEPQSVANIEVTGTKLARLRNITFSSL